MKIKNISLILAGALSISMLNGCGIYKKYNAADIDSQLVKEYSQALDAQPDSMELGNMSWRQVFTDPVLAGLIDNALQNNKDLANAKLNVDMAHAQLKGARLSYLPSVVLAPNGAGASYAKSAMSWSYTLPMQVSWEIDIFGKLLNSKRGAEASYKQAQYYEQAVRSQIIAGVANCYYGISALEKQLEISRSTAEIWKQSVQVMRDLKEAGRLNESAVVQSIAQYYSILGSITDLEVALHQLNNTMSLLMNVMPQTWEIPSGASLEMPSNFRRGVPMMALSARPDVRAAEMNLAAAFYSTASARAAFYPGLAITANGGFTNLLGSVIVNPGDWFVQLAGSLTVPVFMRGQNIARLEAAKATQKQALNNFEYSLMSGAAEVSEAITTYEKAVEKEDYLAVQVDNMSKSVDYTSELLIYGGTTTYLEVLTAQQGLLSAQLSKVNSNLAATQAVINLYQSLGGGR
ncbi:MAG: TolC family protein [Lachnoclostridium sp.]|nr:TolC family protein [Lachnoclostridium sp.]